MNKYYVYIHRRASDNKTFYVGKGCGGRAWHFTTRNNFWKNVKNKHGVIVEIVFDNLSEEEALQIEKDTLLEFQYFGYPLTNLTSGGKSPIFSTETRLKLSLSRTGMKSPRADKKVYTFENTAGLIFIGTRVELCETFQLSKRLIRKLFVKSPNKTCLGWKLIKESNTNET